MKFDDIDIFADDVQERETSPESDVKVLTHAYLAANPSPFDIFGKLNFIFMMTTVVYMIFLPQFGVALMKWPALYAFLDKLDDKILQSIFGFILLGLCAAASVIFLNRDELRVLRQLRFIQFPTLCLIILLAFLIFGMPVLTTATLFWVGGALVGAFSAFETGYAIKYRAWEKQLLAA